MDSDESTPLKGDDGGWRYSSVLVVLRLFIECMNGIPSVTNAILPDLLDKLYRRNYACANFTVTGSETFQDDDYSRHVTGNESLIQDGGCTYSAKPFIVGSFVAYTSVFEVIFSLTVPYVVERLGIRWTCIISVLMQITGSTMTGFATNLWMLYIARFLHGLSMFSEVACFAAIDSKFSDENDRRRGVYWGLQGFLFGNITSYFFGPLIYDYFGQTPTYLFMSSLLLCELVICLIVKDPETTINYPKNYSIFIKDINVVLAISSGVAAWYLIASWQSVFHEWLYSIGARTSHIGSIIIVATLVQTFISMTYSKATIANHWYGILGSTAIAIPGFIFIPTTNSLYWLSILPTILVLTSYCCVVASMSTIIEEGTESNPILNFNIFILIANIGSALGGFSGGLLAQVFGTNNTFFIAGSTAACLTILLVIKVVYDGCKEVGSDQKTEHSEDPEHIHMTLY